MIHRRPPCLRLCDRSASMSKAGGVQRTILLLSGPNLNLLGVREPEIYGDATLDDHVARARKMAETHGYELEHLQSNHEGALVDAIHGARDRCGAVIFNAGAFTHYAYGLADALACFDGVVVELHISNPSARETWRRTSVIAPVATACIAGCGGLGYELAVQAAVGLIAGGRS